MNNSRQVPCVTLDARAIRFFAVLILGLAAFYVPPCATAAEEATGVIELHEVVPTTLPENVAFPFTIHGEFPVDGLLNADEAAALFDVRLNGQPCTFRTYEAEGIQARAADAEVLYLTTPVIDVEEDGQASIPIEISVRAAGESLSISITEGLELHDTVTLAVEFLLQDYGDIGLDPEPLEGRRWRNYLPERFPHFYPGTQVTASFYPVPECGFAVSANLDGVRIPLDPTAPYSSYTFEMSSNRVVQALYHHCYDDETGNEYENDVVFSDPRPLNVDAEGDGVNDSAPWLAADESGNWVAVWERELPGEMVGFDVVRNTYAARSADGGVTWSEPERLNGSDFNGFNPRVFYGDGVWLAQWADYID